MSTQTLCTSLGTFKALSLIILATMALFQVSSSLEVNIEQLNQSPALLNNYAVLDTGYNTQNTRFTALIGYTGEGSNYINATNPISKYLELTVSFQNPSQFQIKIVDANATRWEIPNEAPFPHSDPAYAIPIDTGLARVEIKTTPFAIKVTRKSTGEVIFDTSIGNFMYSDYYLEIATKIPTPYIYGLGERGFNMTLGPNGIYTIWAADYNQNVESGLGGHNSYGTHPVYLSKEKSGNWNMVLLRNLNAMDCVIANSQTLTYKITGGVLDFNFFLGDSSPETAITSYHKYLGGWTMPPFWSMGYQQSRWGYNNIQDFEDLVNNFTEYSIPVDVLWSDIDYMAEYVDFTIDEERFPLKEFNELLQSSGKRWVPIIDAGIGVVAEEVYNKGAEMDVYIKAPNGTYVTGYVWPGGTVWIDWFHPNASRFWEEGLEQVHQKVPYSGLWLDMNEISNLVDGEIDFMPNLTDIRNALPYTPGNPLYTDTIRLDAVHYNGETDFNTHNLYHFMECNITYNYLKEQNKLPFILTRSNTFGTGKYAFHWTGDNNSSWTMLQLSIPAIMNFNIFGMPMTGSDICGFKKNTTEELCARWMQLGLLYPFSRNHAENDTIHQEPWSFDDTLLETSKIAIDTKYALLKYYYSLFIEKNGYGTIFRPLFFEFPEDPNAMNPSETIVDRQFLLGKGLMASPVVEEGVTEVDVYFPGDRWFDFFTGEVMHSQYDHGMIYEDYPAPLNSTVPLFLRGGHIVHTQSTKKVMRSDDLDNNYTLTIGLKETSSEVFEASGKIMAVSDYSENNIYEKCMEENCLLDIDATAKGTSTKCETKIQFTADGLKSSLDKVGIGAVHIYGCFSDNDPSAHIPWIMNQAYLNGQPVGKSLQRGGSTNVFEINLSHNDQPVLVKSGDTITIVSQYMNH